MLKKSGILLIAIVLIIGTCPNIFAANLKTRLDVIQNASETKNLENDQGYISKTIVDSNSDTGEVTIELKLSNKSQKQETYNNYENTEIFLIVDENIVNHDESFNKLINNIETLSNKVFDTNNKTKIGILGIKGPICDMRVDENDVATWGENDQSTVNGNDSNAEIVVPLTNSIDTIKNGLMNMNPSKTIYYTNLQATIKLGNNSFSNNVNRILISLYDKVPSIANGVYNKISYGGWTSIYDTAEEAAVAKYSTVSNNTKNEILKLKQTNTSFILLRPGDTGYDSKFYNTRTGELVLNFDGSPYVQNLYGTIDNPTYGKMYTFDDTTIDTIITENIYQDIKDLLQLDMTDVKIVDYFPDDIMENFEFEYVENPSKGTTDKIDEEAKTITWDIGTLGSEEEATLKYKLKIKDMEDTALLNKTIATNEKVVLTYEDGEDTKYTVELTNSPKIKLTEVKEELTATVSYDPTTNTTGNVVATIKTNKKVNEVEGWTLSEDGKTLTKTYSKNTKETVHLVDLDGMTKDVSIVISNIVEKDTTVATKTIPKTGVNYIMGMTVIILITASIIGFKKYNGYKDVK